MRQYFSINVMRHIIHSYTVSQKKETLYSCPYLCSPDLWPPNSPDLNPVNYKICGCKIASTRKSEGRERVERVTGSGSDISVSKINLVSVNRFLCYRFFSVSIVFQFWKSFPLQFQLSVFKSLIFQFQFLFPFQVYYIDK